MSDRTIYNATGRQITLNINVKGSAVPVTVEPFFKSNGGGAGAGRPVNQEEFDVLKSNRFFQFLEENNHFTVNRPPGVQTGTPTNLVIPARLQTAKAEDVQGERSGEKIKRKIRAAGKIKAPGNVLGIEEPDK